MSGIIAAARYKLAKRLEDLKTRPGMNKEAGCHHDWKRYKQRIPIDNEKYTQGSQPYFVVLGCEMCHEKHTIDMKMGI